MKKPINHRAILNSDSINLRRRELFQKLARQVRLIFVLVVLLILPAMVHADTITGTIRNTSGQPIQTNVTFAPLSTPLVISNDFVPSTVTNVQTAGNGTFSVALSQGDYKVTVGGATKDSVIISVPGDGGTHSLASVITSEITYTSPYIPAYELIQNRGAINGYASLNGSGLIPPAQLGNGTANATTFLRGDGSWVVVSVDLSAATNNDNLIGSRATNHVTTTSNALNTAISAKVSAANNGSDFANMTTARHNLAVLDINANSGISGLPEYAWTNATASFPGQIGIAANSAVVAIYRAKSTTKGDWQAVALFNGATQVGSQYGMTTFSGSDVGMRIWANGNLSLIGTNGVAQGSERTLVLCQPDPRQATYLNFSAPSSWDGVNQLPVMGNDVDFQVGIGGFLYGANTLSGIAINRDALITLNPPVDLHFTTTENAAPFGCRSFLSYDNSNGIWHFPVDRAGNGAYGNAGYQDVLTIDTKLKTITSTNAAINLTGSPINLGPSGIIQAVAGEVYIGTGAGTANNGKVAASQFSITASGTYNAPTILNRATSTFINQDSSGNTSIGKYVNGTGATDADFFLRGDKSYGFLRIPMTVGATNATAACALIEMRSTTQGFLLPRMTKLERDNIASKVAGLVVYQTDNTPGLRVYNGTAWVKYSETAD